jgi:hypothetical protein
MNYTIDLVDYVDTELEPNHTWVNYECRHPGTNELLLISWMLEPDGFSSSNQQEDIRQFIAERGGVDKFPRLSELHPMVAKLITSCHYSDNEMWFIDEEDEQFEDYQITRRAMEECIKQWNLGMYILFDDKDNDSFITVFGGVSAVINWRRTA